MVRINFSAGRTACSVLHWMRSFWLRDLDVLLGWEGSQWACFKECDCQKPITKSILAIDSALTKSQRILSVAEQVDYF